MLTRNVCSRPPITIMHVGDIRRAVGEIVSYHKKDWLSPFFGSCNIYLLTFPWPSLLSFVYWIF